MQTTYLLTYLIGRITNFTCISVSQSVLSMQ